MREGYRRAEVPAISQYKVWNKLHGDFFESEFPWAPPQTTSPQMFSTRHLVTMYQHNTMMSDIERQVKHQLADDWNE